MLLNYNSYFAQRAPAGRSFGGNFSGVASKIANLADTANLVRKR
jgi:hypothetical protein